MEEKCPKCEKVQTFLANHPDKLSFTAQESGEFALAGMDETFTPDEVKMMLTKFASTVVSPAKVLEELQLKKTASIDLPAEGLLPKKANTAVIVDMYEVDYVPTTLGQSTQAIEKNFDAIDDFVSRMTFPDTTVDDLVVGPKEQIFKKKQITQKRKDLPPEAGAVTRSQPHEQPKVSSWRRLADLFSGKRQVTGDVPSLEERESPKLPRGLRGYDTVDPDTVYFNTFTNKAIAFIYKRRTGELFTGRGITHEDIREKYYGKLKNYEDDRESRGLISGRTTGTGSLVSFWNPSQYSPGDDGVADCIFQLIRKGYLQKNAVVTFADESTSEAVSVRQLLSEGALNEQQEKPTFDHPEREGAKALAEAGYVEEEAYKDNVLNDITKEGAPHGYFCATCSYYKVDQSKLKQGWCNKLSAEDAAWGCCNYWEKKQQEQGEANEYK